MPKSRLKRKSLSAIASAIVVAIALVVAAVALPARSLAATVLDYDNKNTSNPVADNITRLNVNKLEKGSRDHVKGAHMVIIEKETGKVVAEWTTDGSVHEVARNTADPRHGALNVDTVYILRELEAPEGYAKAADTEFVIHSDNFNTTGEIIKGDDAESEEIHGSGPEQAFVINLYDEAVVRTQEERIVTRTTGDESGDERHVSSQETRTITTVRSQEYGDEETNVTSREETTSRQNTVTTQNQNTTRNQNSTTTSNNTSTGQSTGTNSNTQSGSTSGGSSTQSRTSSEWLSQTGDYTSLLPTTLTLVAIAIIAAAVVFRRRRQE